MRTMRQATHDLTWFSLHHARGGMIGVPFVLLGCTPGFAFGWHACIAGLVIAGLANFVIYMPLTALTLNGGVALAGDAPAPLLTTRSFLFLLVLWTATAWLGADTVPYLR